MSGMIMQRPLFSKDEVLAGLRQMDITKEAKIEQMLLYPYYFFEFKIQAASLLKLNGRMACTIDAVSGQGAVVDVQPDPFNQNRGTGEPLPVKVERMEAEEAAKRFISQTLSQKAKFLTVPSLRLIKLSLFYRPYWLVRFSEVETGEPQQQVIVDAISGSYHPL